MMTFMLTEIFQLYQDEEETSQCGYLVINNGSFLFTFKKFTPNFCFECVGRAIMLSIMNNCLVHSLFTNNLDNISLNRLIPNILTTLMSVYEH